jgi:CheY-like chemotaxis protein
VAEDNATNQKLIVKLLERDGHRVTIVGNGREAVSAAAAGGFDVVLMDVQMPEMSGFEATAAIREQDRASGRHTPIVAMTAHAMAGDRDRALAAGMDQYVAKPLRPRELLSALARVVPIDGPYPSQSGAADAATVDGAGLLADFDGSRALLAEVIEVFVSDTPATLERLRRAVVARELAEVARAAHALKGSIGLFSRGAAFEAARMLEHLAKQGDATNVDAFHAALQAEAARLTTELRHLCASLRAE